MMVHKMQVYSYFTLMELGLQWWSLVCVGGTSFSLVELGLLWWYNTCIDSTKFALMVHTLHLWYLVVHSLH